MNTTKIFRVFVLIGLTLSFPAGGSALPPRAASTFGDGAREALIKALTAKLNARSYRIKQVQTTNVGLSITQGVDYVAPDRYHVIAEAGTDARKGARQEMILIGQRAYSKTPAGTWQETQIDLQKLEMTRARDRMLIENLRKAQDADIKFSGGVQDGMQAFVYEQTIAAAPKIVTRSRTTTWVGVADGFPRKVEIAADTDFDGRALSLKSTTTYYDYNADIRIKAPL